MEIRHFGLVTVGALSFVALGGCAESPDPLGERNLATTPPLRCEPPPVNRVELSKSQPVSLKSANLLALPSNWRQAGRRRIEAEVDSSASTVLVPLFCDGPDAPSGCETGFAIAQQGRTAQFLSARVHSDGEPLTNALISSDGSVVLRDRKRVRIFDETLRHDFEIEGRSDGITEILPGVVRIVEEFGVRVWVKGELRFIVPESKRVVDLEPAGEGLFARTTDSDLIELLWIAQPAGELQVRPLLEAQKIERQSVRVDREGRQLLPEQAWFCVESEASTELQLVEPDRGVVDRIPAPDQGCAHNRLLSAPGEGLWIVHRVPGNDVLYRPSGEYVFTAPGWVEAIMRASEGWIMTTRRSSYEDDLYTVSPEGETFFVGSAPFGFELASVDGIRVAVSRYFSGASEFSGVLVFDADGQEAVARTLAEEIVSWSLSPSGQLWLTTRSGGREALHVFSAGEEPAVYEGLGLGTAYWIGQDGLLQLHSADQEMSGLYRARGSDLERLTYGRLLQRVPSPAGAWFKYFIDNRGTTELAVFENGSLTVVERSERMNFGRDLQGRTWIESFGLDARMAHRLDASGLSRDVFGMDALDEMDFLGFASRRTSSGEVLWAHVEVGTSDFIPCVCSLDDTGCSAAPVAFDTISPLPNTKPGGPMLIGTIGDRPHIWFDTQRTPDDTSPVL